MSVNRTTSGYIATRKVLVRHLPNEQGENPPMFSVETIHASGPTKEAAMAALDLTISRMPGSSRFDDEINFSYVRGAHQTPLETVAAAVPPGSGGPLGSTLVIGAAVILFVSMVAFSIYAAFTHPESMPTDTGY